MSDTNHGASPRPDSRKLVGVMPIILAALVGLLAVSVLPIIGYTYWQDTRTILNLSDRVIDRLSETVIEQVTSRLWHAGKVAEMSASYVRPYMDSLPDNPELEAYLFAAVRVHPRMANTSLADEHGNFLMLKKLPNGTIATKRIDQSVQPPLVTWKHRDSEGKVVKNETLTEDEYDPRTRPWYQGAKDSGTLHLTDMYIFFTDKNPGVTVSAPILGKHGTMVGVFGIDVELSEISDFLRTLKIGNSGVAFITDKRYRVLAYPDPSRLVKWENGEPRFIHIDEVGVDWIAAAHRELTKTGANRLSFEHEGTRYLGSFTPFPKEFGNPWILGIVVPEDDFIGSIKETSQLALLIAAVILIVAVTLAVAIARSISRPIVFLSGEARKIRNFELDGHVDLKPKIKELHLLAAALSSTKTGLQAFGKYVPAQLVRQLIQTGEATHLGGKKRELTFFFSDIVGFTPVSERMSPEALMAHISEYLHELTNIVMAKKGTVDKYIGDAIMAFWGAPVPDPDHAVHACDAALLCQQKIGEMNEQWKREGKAPLPTRIGIHTGEAIVGNIGSNERMNYTALGDSVNLASRLEGANKIYGTRIIISQSVYERVSGQFICRSLDRIAVKGKAEGVMIYELMGREGDAIAPELTDLAGMFSRALESYFRRDWTAAIATFSDILERFPEDHATALYIDRCERYREDPPGEDWTGIIYMDSK